MGNTNSELPIKKTKEDLYPDFIHKIATDFIMSHKFQDLLNLHNYEYCNNLTILSSDKIYNNLNFIQTKNLNDKIMFTNKKNIDSLDEKDSTIKKDYCNNIAKFYIKIAHLFSVIKITTSNEKDKLGFCHDKLQQILEKYNILTDKSLKPIILNNFEKKYSFTIIPSNDKPFELITELNKKKTKEYVKLKPIKLPELTSLYLDIYDDKTGKFNKMSDISQKKYQNDVNNMYKAITGKKTVPINIQHFSDIEFKSYNNILDHNLLNQGNIDDKLLQEIYKNIQLLRKFIDLKQSSLLNIIDELFLYNNKTGEISIHTDLNMHKLNFLIEETREIILNMYIGCDNDANIIYELFEQFIKKRIMENTDNKILHLKQKEESLLSVL